MLYQSDRLHILSCARDTSFIPIQYKQIIDW